MCARRSNKFTVVKWYLSIDCITFYFKDNKIDFMCDILNEKTYGYLFSKKHDDGLQRFIHKSPSVKETAWFMGSSGSGGFFIRQYQCPSVRHSFDKDFLFTNFEFNRAFYQRNSIVAPSTIYRKRGTFLPPSPVEHMLIKFMGREDKKYYAKLKNSCRSNPIV